MADLPNTEAQAVMIYAIAWEIAKRSVQEKGAYLNGSPEDRTRILANEFLRAYQAVKQKSEIT